MKKFKKDKHVLIPEQETNFDMVRNMNDAELASLLFIILDVISVRILKRQKIKIVLFPNVQIIG